MKTLDDKAIIDNAIDNYSVFSASQKSILKTLVRFEMGVTTETIIKLTGLSKQIVNFSLKKLLQQNIVSREKIRVFVYKTNRIRILEILDFYKQQLELEKK